MIINEFIEAFKWILPDENLLENVNPE